MVLETRNLQSQYPEIAKEWDYEKNGDLLPSQVSKSSAVRVWWKCEKGHEWITSVNNRTSSHHSSRNEVGFSPRVSHLLRTANQLRALPRLSISRGLPPVASHEEPPADAGDGVSVQRQAGVVDLQRGPELVTRRGRESAGRGEEASGGLRERVAGDGGEPREQVEEQRNAL